MLQQSVKLLLLKSILINDLHTTSKLNFDALYISMYMQYEMYDYFCNIFFVFAVFLKRHLWKKQSTNYRSPSSILPVCRVIEWIQKLFSSKKEMVEAQMWMSLQYVWRECKYYISVLCVCPWIYLKGVKRFNTTITCHDTSCET